jgi:hypothetical protein
MISPDQVSAVLVTRGDCDLTDIELSLVEAGIRDVVIWDNSQRDDMGIYGRYRAIKQAKNTVVVTQDDDVLVTCWDEILAAYEPGVLTVNYPEPWDIPWVARGSIFDCELPAAAFDRYLDGFPFDQLFTHRICDAVFALLSDTKVIDHGSTDLPHGFDDGRVSTSQGWYDRDRPEAQRRCSQIKVAA